MIAAAHGEAGFGAPLVAVAMLLVSIPLVAAADATADLGSRLRQAQERLDAETAAVSATARAAHLLVTEPIGNRSIRIGGGRLDSTGVLSSVPRWRSIRGERELMLDGRPYAVRAQDGSRSSIMVSVQDEAGLLNVNGGDDTAAARLLELGGVPRDISRQLGAALADFSDSDELRRLYGAERRDYRRAGLPEPLDAPLSRPGGAAMALGWRDRLTWRQLGWFVAHAAALPAGSGFNPGTAPAPVRKAVLGAESLGGLPSRHFKVRIRIARPSSRQPDMFEARLSFPEGGAQPLVIGLVAPTDQWPADAEHDHVQFPDSPALLASRGR